MLAALCLTSLTLVGLLLSPLSVAAYTQQAHDNGPLLQVTAGFDGRYRDGNWLPIQLKLSNNGTDFAGSVSIDIPSPYSNNTTSSIYQAPVTLATGAQKQITLSIPLALGAQGSTQNITLHLLNNNGQIVSTQTTSLRSLGPNDVFIGILSDQASGFGPLNAVALPNQSQSAALLTEPLNASNMPTDAALLRNFDLIVLDNFTTSTLSSDQIAALQEWVNQGGTLLCIGGPEWHTTLSPLPTSLLPVTITGTQTLPAGTALLPIGDPGNSPTSPPSSPNAASPLVVSVGQAETNSTTILASGNTPLLVQANQVQGHIDYLAFDPTLDPLLGWSQASQLWKGLLFRTLGDQLVAQNPNRPTLPVSTNVASRIGNSMLGLLQTFLPNTLPSVMLILVILLGYILTLGPLRFLVVRHFKRRDWNWRIILSSIALFSLLSYGIALFQKGTSVVSDTITIVQLGTSTTNDTPAYTTTYVGVFVPSAGNFSIHLGMHNLAQPASSPFQFGPQSSQQLTTVTQAANGTDVILQSTGTWTFNTITSEQASILHGSLTSQLLFQNGLLSGTVTNGLPYALSDAYALMGSSYTAIGHLAPHQTKFIHLSLTNSTNPNTPLADQIATDNGFPAQSTNGGYTVQTPRSSLERHIDMLAAFSGEGAYCANNGGPCYASPYKVVTSSGVVMVSNNGTSITNNTPDPLLLPNTPATLIGWADTTTNPLTINGNQPTGAQETFIQAPLSVQYAGTVNLPASFITGHIINVDSQGTNIQEVLPGIYTMLTGSMTFELLAPPHLHITNALINETQNIATTVLQNSGPTSGTLNDISHAQISLYNWHTNTWDSITINPSTFSIPINDTNSYVGPNGRILVQFANQNTSLGTLVFDTPSLQVQGNAQ